MAPTGWHSITPTGLAANIYGTALAFSILSTIVLALRVIARLKMDRFSREDWLMCTGWVWFSYAVFIHSYSHCCEVPADADTFS